MNLKSTKQMIEYGEAIIEKVALYYNIRVNDVKGKSRKQHFVRARFISMYFIRLKTSLTLTQIGDMLGRDHTTVLHSLQSIKDTLSLHYDTILRDELTEIKRLI